MIVIIVIIVVVSIFALIELQVALRNWESAFGFRNHFFCVCVILTGSDRCPSLQRLIQAGCVN